MIARSVLILVACLAISTAGCSSNSTNKLSYPHNEVTNLLTLDAAVAFEEGNLRLPSAIECLRVATTLQERVVCVRPVLEDIAASSTKQNEIFARAAAMSSGDCLTALNALKRKSEGVSAVVKRFQQMDVNQMTQADLERFIKMADGSGSLNPEMDAAIQTCASSS
jgi:hypothetical protein